MTRRLIIRTLVGAFIAQAGAAAAQTCFVADPIWLAGHAQASGALSARVVTMGSNLSAQRAITLEMLLSATKVHTAQIATNGLRETNLANGTQQAVAATLAQIGQREALVAAKEQYSIETGQGVNACTSINLMVDTNEALGNVAKNAREEYRELDVAPGKATPVAQAVRKRLANASRTDSAVLLDPAGSDSDRQAVIEAMTGLPMPVADRTMSGSEADLTMLRTRRVEALRSPALVSLSAVRAMSATEGHQTASAAVAPLRQLDVLVEQYGGGPRFEAWSAALAGQSERGLLVELSRLRSMSLTLRQALIEQQARTTAVFGTMLAVQAGGQL